MTQAADLETQTVLMRFDPKVHRRLALAALGRDWDRWFYGAGVYGLIAGGCAAVAQLAAEPESRSSFRTFWFAFALGFIATWVTALIDVGRVVRKNANDVDELEFSEAGLAFTWKGGVRLFAPWTTARLEVANRDGWTVKMGERRHLIFRKTLEDAGLVETFLTRIQAPKGSARES